MLKCDAEELKMTAEQFKEHKQKLRRTVDLLRRSQKRRACAAAAESSALDAAALAARQAEADAMAAEMELADLISGHYDEFAGFLSKDLMS